MSQKIRKYKNTFYLVTSLAGFALGAGRYCLQGLGHVPISKLIGQ